MRNRPNTINPDTLDCYEVMQLSPNADADTIARVYRMLALRYHPDNTETGNSEMFVRLSEAHQILSDPEKRASYDVRHREAKRLHWKIFDQASASTGTEGEKRKRQGILALLYAKMLSDPEQAEMNIQSLEELLGCPREHLQAPLWYLKGKTTSAAVIMAAIASPSPALRRRRRGVLLPSGRTGN